MGRHLVLDTFSDKTLWSNQFFKVTKELFFKVTNIMKKLNLRQGVHSNSILYTIKFSESVAEWSRSRTHDSDVVGSRPGAAELFNCTY
jgi:hypothetical protein